MYKIYTKFLYAPPVHVSKWLLIMKLTTFILIVTLMQASATTFGQRITINQSKISIKQILSEIKKQTGYGVLIRSKGLDLNRKLNASFNDRPIEDVFITAFGTNYSYTIEDQVIVVRKMEERSFLDKNVKSLQEIEVKGKVVDENGRGIPGVTVRVKEGKYAILTSTDGSFFIKGVDKYATLIFTFIGYNIKEAKVQEEMGNIQLKLADNALDEVQVIAYGQTTRRFDIGNVSSISSKQIENKPVDNVLLALQGEVPGITIRKVNGYANSGISTQIQGIASLANSNSPLYVVDGVPIPSQMPLRGSAVGGDSNSGSDFFIPSGATISGNPLNFLNPQDIASVSILKGADATSIYGSRGAMGVIMITTKKGTSGDARIDIMAQEGFSQYPKFLKLMDLEQYLQMRRDAFKNDGLPIPNISIDPNDSNYDLNGFWDNSRYTDWQETLLGGTAHYSDYNASLSGGSAQTQYRLSANYQNQTTVLRRDDLMNQKLSMNSNLSHVSTNQRFKLNFSANYQYDDNKAPDRDLTSSAVQMSPVAPSLYHEDGTLNWALDANGNPTRKNPLAMLEIQSKQITTNLISNLRGSYQLLKNLEISSTIGYTSLRLDEILSTPSMFYSPTEIRNGAKPSSFFNNAQNQSWSIEPQVSYRAAIGKGKLEILVGAALNSRSSRQTNSIVQYNTDLQLDDPGAGAIQGGLGRIIDKYRYGSLFSRAGYIWDNKYLVNASLRRDGSSNFGSNNRYHDFFSVGGGWIFSEEKLFKDNARWLSYAKIRGSYGTTGSDNIGSYGYLTTYNNRSLQNNYQQLPLLLANNLPNSDLQWEKTSKLDFGLDLGFLNNRILLNSTYFRNRSDNQLVNNSIPSIGGATSYRSNLDAVIQNTGFEFSLSTENLKSKDFSWRTSLNVSSYRNKLLSFPQLDRSSLAYTFVVGQPISSTKVYDYVGVDPQSGLYQFRKKDGTITSDIYSLDLARDGVSVNRSMMRYAGGITNTFVFRNIEFSFLVDFSIKDGPVYGGWPLGAFSGNDGGYGGFGNQPAYVSDYWKGPNQQGTYQKPSSILYGDAFWATNDYFANSTFNVKNTSYAKLRNVNLTYRLPESLLGWAKLRSGSVFANAQNVYTLTAFRGADPESADPLGLPPLRTLSFGVRLGL